MKEYPKIDTVYLRDPNTNHKTLLEGQYTNDVFRYLASNEWVFTEKVDGTNIRLMIHNGAIAFGGKTDNAQIPSLLIAKLQELFLPQKELLLSIFQDGGCLYGEGYGAKIQKGGDNYRPDQDFVLFDVLVGAWWLQRADIEEIASKLAIDVVPIIGHGTLPEMVELVRTGFNSQWGQFLAEGIVARPAVELKTRNGQRIITKIKHKDFR